MKGAEIGEPNTQTFKREEGQEKGELERTDAQPQPVSRMQRDEAAPPCLRKLRNI